MTFLAPALLALGLAVAVPLALHLLQRHQGPRFVFPAIRYLRRAEREHASRLRLRQILLLALRVLAILLIAAAAARPFLPVGGGDHPPTSVVIVLDNSMATGGVVEDRRVLDHLKDAALETLARAGPDDRLWLIRAGEPWEPAVTGELGVVEAAVRRTDPAAAEADLPAQLARARSILASEPDDRPREIHLLSDLRARSFAGSGPGSSGEGQAPVLVLDPPARLTDNRAVTSVEVGGGLPPRAGERTTVTVRLDRFGTVVEAPPDSTDIRLVVEGTVLAVVRAPVGATAALSLPAREPGIVTGRVEIDSDALAADDRRYFQMTIRPPPAVWLAEPLMFLDEAIAVLAEAGRVRRATTAPGDVVVAPGGRGVDAVLRGSGVVVLPPATPLELAGTNQRLGAGGVPWRLGPPGPGEARLDPDDTGLGEVLAGVQLHQVYSLEPVGDPAHTVLLRLRTGEAWAVAGTTETGRYLILGTPLTPDGGTIPTSAAMLPLLDRAINAWVGGASDAVEHRPGDVVTLAVGDSIVRPDGASDPVRSGSVYRLTEAGVYLVFEADSLVAAFAVNPSPTASDVRALSHRDAVERLAGADAQRVSARAWGGAVFQRRLGQDLALPLLVAALLVLLVESAIAGAGRATVRQDPV